MDGPVAPDRAPIEARKTLNLNGVITGCHERHASKIGGRWFRGTDDELGFLFQGNGAVKYRLRCRACHCESSDIPHNQGRRWQEASPITWTRIRPSNVYPPCVVLGCLQDGSEDHHFAPRNTFGDEADNWPVLALCHEHHFFWHRTMDGYRWHARAVAA